ncbi:MAG: 16S rRNA (guanine(966)-N(2))-methyltransferase RsmD [Desulfobacterota bacterium]|nr:16S rRNA (guanine(966)-N(2))-methyltransferase RsmD [Thermodesulfobacteriota bacterium]
MRVTGGKLKGRRLYTGKIKGLRPSSEKIREAIFNILTPFLTGDAVLDLFAGTGSLGIEALSRGMEEGVFVECNSAVIALLKKNIEGCQLSNQAEILKIPVSKALRVLKAREKKFKLIFLDPPYQERLVEKTLLELNKAEILISEGIIVAEHFIKEAVGEIYGKLRIIDRRQYGQSVVSFFFLW